MGKTTIEWTDATWNPIRARNRKTGKIGHYCEMVSPGCANCYASGFQPRFGLPAYVGPGQRKTKFEDIEPFLDEETLGAPLRWKKPRRIFVCSMTDLFGDWVPDEWIDRCFAAMALTPQHTHQVLTKRPERMREYFSGGPAHVHRIADDMARGAGRPENSCGGYMTWPGQGPSGWPLPNVWLGVSVEDQQRADERIPLLLQIPAAVRFLSVEPMLGPVNLAKWIPRFTDWANAGGPNECKHGFAAGIPCPDCTPRLHWVIIGGESGKHARPCNLAWIRSLVEQCRAASCPVFIKQLGVKPYCEAEPLPVPQSVESMMRHGEYDPEPWKLELADPKGGSPAEWPADLRIQEFPR